MNPYEWLLEQHPEWHITPEVASEFDAWYAANAFAGQHYEDAWIQSKLWASLTA